MKLATLFLVVTLGTGSGYTVGTPNAGTVTIMDNDGLANLLEYAVGTKGTITSKIAASATWTDADTLVMTWRYYETPHSDTVTCKFDGDQLSITFRNSVTAMNPKAADPRAPLKGNMQT